MDSQGFYGGVQKGIITGAGDMGVELIGNNSNKLKIFFDKNSLDLSGWETIDSYSNEVIFFIKNIKKNMPIENKIFVIPKEEDL